MSSTTIDRTEIASLRASVVRLHRRLRRQSATELTPSQMSALITLHRHGAMRVGDLARRELIAKSSVTRLVSRLAERGCIRRWVDPGDARSAQVELTARGRDVVKAYHNRADDYLARQVGALSVEDRTILWAALPVLTRLVEGSR